MNKPTLQEKDRAIEHILAEGLEEPEGIGAFFMRMYQSLGLNVIFYDLYQVISLSMVMVLGLTMLLVVNIDGYTYTTLFLLSPLSFVAIISLTEWMERNDPICELKRTFKYSVKDMIIFRTLCYSLISVAVSLLLSVGLTGTSDSFRSLSIAFSALFLCILLTVAITRRFNHRLSYFPSFGVWGAMNFVPLILFGSRWEMFLSQIPIGITLIASLGLMYLSIKEIKQFIHMKDREVGYDVAG